MRNTILVVENDKHLLNGIREVLERESYQVITAENGQEALNALQRTERPPDLIVSDIMMPVMDGYTFLQEVRAEREWIDIPIIFLTARTERADVNKGRRLGVDDYLLKPFIPEELLIAVNAKLRRRQEIEDFHRLALQDLRANIMTILNHEFRTPLTYIVGFNDLLRVNPEDITSDELRMLLQRIDRGTRRLRRLIENFIMLVELETGDESMDINLNQIVTNYPTLLRHYLELYEQEAAAGNYEFTAEIDPEAPPIRTYDEYFCKMIDCLLDNAFKFTPKGGTVSLRLQPYETKRGMRYLCIQVQDNGRGVAQKHIPQIFEPFYQAIRKDDEHPGTGSGLAIVRGLVDLHRGRLHVQSEVGLGSTFTVLLPVHEE